MSHIDVEALRKAELKKEPFDWVMVPGFIKADSLEAVNHDYPKLDKPGSFPTSELEFGPEFEQLLQDIQGPEITKAFEEKFDIDLTNRPTMITVRGMCRAKDGKIHTDTDSKIITVLIYMNNGWEADGGRLRLLNGPDDIEDMVAEVPPNEGTLLAFRNGPNAWHGHKSFEGQRRAIQLNWVTDAGVVRREQTRHRFSAKLKKFLG